MITNIALSALSKYFNENSVQSKHYGEDIAIASISIDSRTVKKGQLFVAIVGEHFDGHDFIEKAISNGASAVVTSKQLKSLDNQAYLLVSDTFKALGLLGKFSRNHYSGKVVGITGSSGKTSTKEFVASVLSDKNTKNVLSTQGNLNNYYGVPLMLDRLKKEHQFAVIEMGTSAPGEIAYLSKIAQPNIALITNASAAHLEGLGSVHGVVVEKGSIIKGITPNGTMLFNYDDPAYAEWKARTNKERPDVNIFTFGLNNPDLECTATDIQTDSTGTKFLMHFNGQSYKVQLSLWGVHQVSNACAAALIGLALNISHESIVAGLERVKPMAGRGARTYSPQGALIIDESYNANVNSTKAAIDTLAQCSEKYKILVQGNMAELGDVSEQVHQDIAEHLNHTNIDELLTVGDLAKIIQINWNGKGTHFSDKATLCDYLVNKLEKDVVVLIKGSFSMGLSEVTRICLDPKERMKN